MLAIEAASEATQEAELAKSNSVEAEEAIAEEARAIRRNSINWNI